jgi:hypothetical protein
MVRTKPLSDGSPYCGFVVAKQDQDLLDTEAAIIWVADPRTYRCWPRLIGRKDYVDPIVRFPCPVIPWLSGAEKRGTFTIAVTVDATGNVCRVLFLRKSEVPDVLAGTWIPRCESADPATFAVGRPATIFGSVRV